MEKDKCLAVIGCGYWGKNLVRNFHELGVLHSICDINPQALNLYKEKFPDINITTDVAQILKSPRIKAVAVCTPALTHFDLARKALLSDKDIFIEKPLAMNVKDAEGLIRLADERKKIIMVGHILQYHPAVIKLKELILENKIGKIQYIYSNRLNIGKLRTEENILWSFAPHDISAILMLVGEEPISITAFGGDYLNRGIYDVTLTTLEFKDGVKGHIFVSWTHPYKEQKLIVVGSGAMAVFDDVSEEKLFIYPHKIEWFDGKINLLKKADYYTVPVEKTEPLKEELRHFIDCVVYRKRPKTDGEEGLKVLRVLEAAEKRLKENKDGQKGK